MRVISVSRQSPSKIVLCSTASLVSNNTCMKTPTAVLFFSAACFHRKGRSLILLVNFTSLRCGWNWPHLQKPLGKKSHPYKTGVYVKPEESNKWQSKSNMAAAWKRDEVKKITWMSTSWLKTKRKNLVMIRMARDKNRNAGGRKRNHCCVLGQHRHPIRQQQPCWGLLIK